MKWPWNGHEIHGDIWRLSWRIFSKTWRLTCWKLAGPKEKCKPSRHSTTSDVQGAKPWNSWNLWCSKWPYQQQKRDVFPQVMVIWRNSHRKMRFWTMMNQEIFGPPKPFKNKNGWLTSWPSLTRTPQSRAHDQSRAVVGPALTVMRSVWQQDLKIPWFYQTVQDGAPQL